MKQKIQQKDDIILKSIDDVIWQLENAQGQEWIEEMRIEIQKAIIYLKLVS